jgi:hypothetical protein
VFNHHQVWGNFVATISEPETNEKFSLFCGLYGLSNPNNYGCYGCDSSDKNHLLSSHYTDTFDIDYVLLQNIIERNKKPQKRCKINDFEYDFEYDEKILFVEKVIADHKHILFDKHGILRKDANWMEDVD